MKNNKSRKSQTSSTEVSRERDVKVEIYVKERFYGRIKMKFPPLPQYRDEEDIIEEIVRRMPSLKNEDFTISF